MKKEETLIYQSPQVEVIEVEVENGFAASGGEYPGWGGEYPL